MTDDFTGHTPGPWLASNPGDYGDYHGQLIVIEGDDMRIIVVLGDGEEALANSRLVVATPRLLAERDAAREQVTRLMAALEEFVEVVPEPPAPNCSCHVAPLCYDCVGYAGLRNAFANARDLLAKIGEAG